MAKGWEITNLDPNVILAEKARAIIITKFQEAFHYQALACTSSDPEVVHDMRVSLRRLWAAMSSFGPLFNQSAKYLRLAKKTRRLARKLGAVRDLDVLIELLNAHKPQFSQSLPALNIIEKLISHYNYLKNINHAKLSKYLDKLDKKEFKDKFLQGFENFSVSQKEPAQKAKKIFLETLENFYAQATQSIKNHALHQLRIAAKKLRYCLEFFELCYQMQVTDYLKLLRRLQEILGDIHDCDVMMQQLAAGHNFWGEENDPLLAQGLAELTAQFQAERVAKATEFLDLWTQKFSHEFEPSLYRLLSQAK